VLAPEGGMRIAMVAPLVSPIAEPNVGGSQALLADLAAGLAGRGHDVAVYAASGSRIEGVEVVDTGVDPASLAATLFRADGGAATAVPGTSGATAARDAFDRAVALVAGHGADVVHVHAFDAPAVDAAATLPFPVAHVLHLPPTADVAAAVRRAVRGLRPLTAVTVSRWMEAAWRAEGVPSTVIRNGVPVGRIPWRVDGGEEVLFAGRLSPEKGAVEALEIAARAGTPIRVVGAPYDPRYAGVVGAWRGRPGVTVEGPVPRRRLWALMSNARAVLCPARWDEPFGLVAAESQAAGTPVIGFRRGALEEVVADGITGSLVADGDLDAAARAVADADRFDRTSCRRHAEQTLDLERTLDGYEGLSVRLAETARGVGTGR